MTSILSIAKQIRNAFEEIALCENQNQDRLAGYCYRASAQFLIAAEELGFSLRLGSGFYHVYNVFSQNRKNHIIDVTATQFEQKEKIFVYDLELAQKTLEPWVLHEGLFNNLESFFENTKWEFPFACLLADRMFVSDRLNLPRTLPNGLEELSWRSYEYC